MVQSVFNKIAFIDMLVTILWHETLNLVFKVKKRMSTPTLQLVVII